MTTFDNSTYTFNGLGKFILSKANDSSFEIQAITDILNNVNSNSSLVGTLFTSFAMRTNESSTFEFRLADSQTKNPYLG